MKKRTGYTHQWRTCDPRFKRLVMASCDTEQDYFDATADGWRTFRVRESDEPMLPGEIMCPASKEGGERVQCANCLLCNGSESGAKSIVIIRH